MRGLAFLIATGFGSGLLRPAPGTWGSLLAGVPVSLLTLWASISTPYPAAVYALICFAVYKLGVWCVPHAEEQLGAQTNSYGKIVTKDQGQIVIDEVLGMQVTFIPFVVLSRWPLDLWTGVEMFVAFGLFRFFDSFKYARGGRAKEKIWPINVFDNTKNAHGVMFDDFVAGSYAMVWLFALMWMVGRLPT